MPKYSSDNPASTKNRKSKRLKIDKKNTSEDLHQDKNDN